MDFRWFIDVNPALELQRILHRYAAGLASRVLPAPDRSRQRISRQMLALKEGGRTTGVAYRLPDETLEQELTLSVEVFIGHDRQPVLS